MKGIFPVSFRVLGYVLLLLSVFVPMLMYMFGFIRTDESFILMKLGSKLVVWLSLFLIFLSKTKDEDETTSLLRSKSVCFSLYVLGFYYLASLLLSMVSLSAPMSGNSIAIFYMIVIIIVFEFLQQKRRIEKIRNFGRKN